MSKARSPAAQSFHADLTAEVWLSSLLELGTLCSSLKPLGQFTLGLTVFCSLGKGGGSEGIAIIYLLVLFVCLSWFCLFACFALLPPTRDSWKLVQIPQR